MKHPVIISEKTILKKDLFEVKESEIQFPNGATRTWAHIKRRSSVFIFPITKSYEIYLVSEYRYLFACNILDACAGYMETGEEPLYTAKRELQEEMGITAKSWRQLPTVNLSASSIKSSCYLFLAQELEIGNATPEEVEEIQVIKLPLDEAVEKVLNGEIMIGGAMIGILLLDKLRRENKL